MVELTVDQEGADVEVRRRCTSLYCGPDRRTAVYRFYDRDERLLYAGITYDLDDRWADHARKKPWWPQVRYQTAVWHQTRLGAAIEEHCAIRYENPLHNVARQHDERLGLELTDASGAHAPRPWRLNLLKTAREMHWPAVEIEETRPHHPVVISKMRDWFGGRDIYSIWFPRILELWCESASVLATAPSVELSVYDQAAATISKHLGIDKSEFTLSVHHADGCGQPVDAIFRAAFPELENEEAPAPRWRDHLTAALARFVTRGSRPDLPSEDWADDDALVD